MSSIFAGSTPKFRLKLKDDAGVQLDPSDVNVIAEVKIFIFNSISGEDIGKFYLNTLPDNSGDWTRLTTVTIATGDVRVLLVLTAAMTLAALGNNNTIQVNTHIVDAEAPDGERIVIKKARFPEILPAKS